MLDCEPKPPTAAPPFSALPVPPAVVRNWNGITPALKVYEPIGVIDTPVGLPAVDSIEVYPEPVSIWKELTQPASLPR